ncbi:MAG: four helix bundle protein [bacterium]
MDKEVLKERTKKLSIRITVLVDNMPETRTAKMIAGQLLRSATSVGANYRAACRAKSKRDFINKLKIVEEESDEILYWLELIEERELVSREKLKSLKQETEELLAIFVASLKTAKENLKIEGRK